MIIISTFTKFYGIKNSNKLIIDIIFNEYIKPKFFIKQQKSIKKCKINKLMEIKKIHVCAK